MKITVHRSWVKFFKKYRKNLKEIINSINFDKTILPDKKLIFRTFEYFDIKNTKLVILGQDPYPGSTKENGIIKYYAEGLSFSVNPEINKLPASLKNIFKELKNNYPDFTFQNGSLLKWIQNENIMLLNTALTVQEGKPNIHSKLWLDFTNKVIQELDKKSDCLFLLMGSNAIKKSEFISDKERIISCTHPSPLSAHRGFFGSNIFKIINKKLKEKSLKEINWNL